MGEVAPVIGTWSRCSTEHLDPTAQKNTIPECINLDGTRAESHIEATTEHLPESTEVRTQNTTMKHSVLD